MKLACRPALAAASMLLCLSVTATACSDEPEGDSSSQPPLPTEAPPTFEVQTRTTIGRVVGRLPNKDRKKLVATVTPVVQRWFNAAYVGGDYPRKDFQDAFPGFTAGARAEARRDLALMSNQGIGQQISGIIPKSSRMRLDVLAVRKHAAAVTARFHLAFRTQGDLDRKVRVGGRLLLTRSEAGWRIFGYDVAKTGARA